MDSFFPKCFVLSKQQGNASSEFQNELDEFTEEYRFIFSQTILKKYIQKANSSYGEWKHLVPKLLVSLNICEKRLLSIDEQINQFGECNGELCSETEWKILELTKKQLTDDKIKEINQKDWFKVLTEQYQPLFKDKERISSKLKEGIDMNTEYPLLLDFTKRVLKKLKENYTQFNICGD